MHRHTALYPPISVLVHTSYYIHTLRYYSLSTLHTTATAAAAAAAATTTTPVNPHPSVQTIAGIIAQETFTHPRRDAFSKASNSWRCRTLTSNTSTIHHRHGLLHRFALQQYYT